MSEFHIDQNWLEIVRDSIFYYPAACSDYSEPLAIFQEHISTFWLCDLAYPSALNLPPVFAAHDDFRIVRSQRSGETTSVMEDREAENGRRYHFLKPSTLSETYQRSDGRQLLVIRRRGFGQIAISDEFSDRSIGVFMHRCDSPGESGSNVYFLANKKTYYEPCGNLFDKLGRRLKDRALVISDGSNSTIRQLRRLHNKPTRGSEAFGYHQRRRFAFGGFEWSCVGWLSRGYGPTLVWGLNRQ